MCNNSMSDHSPGAATFLELCDLISWVLLNPIQVKAGFVLRQGWYWLHAGLDQELTTWKQVEMTASIIGGLSRSGLFLFLTASIRFIRDPRATWNSLQAYIGDFHIAQGRENRTRDDENYPSSALGAHWCTCMWLHHETQWQDVLRLFRKNSAWKVSF